MKDGSFDARTLRRRDPQHESQTVIKVGSDFYIRASSLTSRRATRVLVNGESFVVFEVGGDILQTPDEPLGFFHRDTRYLSFRPSPQKAAQRLSSALSRHSVTFSIIIG